MKTFLLALVALLPVWAVAQQMTISPSSPIDGFVTEELVKSGSNFVHTGFKSDQAIVTCHDTFGSFLWSKVCGITSAGRSIASTSTSNFVIAGEIGNDALAATFNSDGSLAWAKSFVTDSTERWNYVATDIAGNAYFVGHKRTNSANSREIWMKLDPSGNTLWAKQALRPSDSYSSLVYCYVKGDSLIAVGVTRNNGVANFGNKDVSLTIINTQTGNVLSHRYFGTVGFESFIEAEANQQGIVILFGIGNSLNGVGSSRAVMKVSWNSLASPATAKILQPSGYDLDMGGELTLDGSDVYVSGGLTGIATQASYVIKLDQVLDIKWAKRLTAGSFAYPTFGNASVGVGGGVALVDAKNGSSPSTQAVLTTLNSSGVVSDPGCATPVAFLVDPISYSMSAGSHTLTYGDLVFGVTSVTFNDYSPQITPCFSTLPVEMLSFVGQQIGQTIELGWTTATELNNSHFNVLRSRDGLEWEEIGQVVGAGTSQTPNDYKFVDENPLSGGNYYRLVQVDLDDTETLSDVVFVNFERQLGVYPNPVSSGEVLRVEDGKPFQVFDGQGKVVLESSVGQATIALVSGMYFVRSVDGATAKLIVN